MLETTDPDIPLPPDQADEQIPNGMKEAPQAEGSLPDTGEQSPLQPKTQTLADKHQARRQAFERLSRLTQDTSDDPPALDEDPEEGQSAASPQGAAQESPGLAPGQVAPAEAGPTIPGEVQNLMPVEEPAMTPEGTPNNLTPSNGSPQESLLTVIVALPRRTRSVVSAWWVRVARRVRPAPAGTAPSSAALAEGQATPPAAPRSARFKAGARRTWTAVRPILWRGRIGPAFWTVASLLSLTVNIILIVILILLGRQLFFLKKAVVSDQLINGLYDNFLLMDQAHIQTTIAVSDTIQVNDTIPVVFDLPLSTNTTVILTRDTPASTTIYLNNTAVPLDLVLKNGTKLNINLDMTVPVNQTIPVTLDVPVNLLVPVDIPLDQTQLHRPFVGLQQVVSPFHQLLSEVPDTWGQACKGPFKFVCDLLKFK